jgi:hypothetical protein
MSPKSANSDSALKLTYYWSTHRMAMPGAAHYVPLSPLPRSRSAGMRPSRRLDLVRSALLLAATAAFVACGQKAAAPPQAETHFESPGGKFIVDFPGTWRGSYSAVEHADTTNGSKFAVEFIFQPDAAWKADPHTLMVVRIFSKSAWDALAARPGGPGSVKIAARGDEVFALSLPPSNPYKPGTPEAARFDQLVLAVVRDSVPLRLTPK